MKITVHIERMILEGLPLAAGESALVDAALRQELAGLLKAGALPRAAHADRPGLRARPLFLPRGSSPARIGRDIAASIHPVIKGRL
jgi:hypothetical protein